MSSQASEMIAKYQRLSIAQEYNIVSFLITAWLSVRSEKYEGLMDIGPLIPVIEGTGSVWC
jgi:hypothetical protein